MKRSMKKIAALFLTLALAVSVLSFPASAALSITGDVDGTIATGTLSVGTNKATATTTYSRVAYIYAHVTFTYGFGDDEETVSRGESSSAGGVSVTVTADKAYVVPLSADGEHTVTYEASDHEDSWTGYTNWEA